MLDPMRVKPNDCRLLGVFAENVRAHRLKQGWSQEELAEKAGVHRTYVGMVERREKNVTIFNIERFAKALGVKASKLLD
jgi:transcriptional regulator with XRE-family HTH domain